MRFIPIKSQEQQCLHCPEGPPALRENYHFSGHEVNRIAAELAGHLTVLCDKWGEIHDQP